MRQSIGIVETWFEAGAGPEEPFALTGVNRSGRRRRRTCRFRTCRNCHLKPDLVLIYRKTDTATLQLVRMGSHSELFTGR